MKTNISTEKLRLILFEERPRNCAGGCNKDWDIKNLPVCSDFHGYQLIMLTGGEPMLCPGLVAKAVEQIRSQTNAPIILYTALLTDKEALGKILDMIDGITVTLHDYEDVAPFQEFDRYYAKRADKSFRLNVFDGIGYINCSDRWKIKSGITWIKDCPLPAGEVLMRMGWPGHQKHKDSDCRSCPGA